MLLIKIVCNLTRVFLGRAAMADETPKNFIVRLHIILNSNKDKQYKQK